MSEPITLESLQAELDAHRATRPRIPHPYLPHSVEALNFQKALADFVDKTKRLKHEIFKLTCPRLAALDRNPHVIPGPGPGVRGSLPARLRR